jgi:hypothetical protein
VKNGMIRNDPFQGHNTVFRRKIIVVQKRLAFLTIPLPQLDTLKGLFHYPFFTLAQIRLLFLTPSIGLMNTFLAA